MQKVWASALQAHFSVLQLAVENTPSQGLAQCATSLFFFFFFFFAVVESKGRKNGGQTLTEQVGTKKELQSKLGPSDLKTAVQRPLTCVGEAEALVGSGGVAVELQPQPIRCAVDDVAQHDVAREVPQKAGRGVLSVVHLTQRKYWRRSRQTQAKHEGQG